MDNLGSHKEKAVRQLIRSAGAKLFFLPKYSPDLNPIEQVFAKIKHLLRKTAARRGSQMRGTRRLYAAYAGRPIGRPCVCNLAINVCHYATRKRPHMKVETH
jgi:hypothetical protein